MTVILAVALGIGSSSPASASYNSCGSDHWATWPVLRHVDKDWPMGGGWFQEDWYDSYPLAIFKGDIYVTTIYCGT